MKDLFHTSDREKHVNQFITRGKLRTEKLATGDFSSRILRSLLYAKPKDVSVADLAHNLA